MDGYSGYNHIKMFEHDAAKTAFRTLIGNFLYTVMPFGFKNTGATYQRSMKTIFHDVMHKQVEDYVDDVVVKSKARASYLEVMRQVFGRCREYKLKMNPLKCAFGVSSGKFLGFLVTAEGIKDAQLRYPKAERACLALSHAMQRFRHYLLSNRVVLVSKADPKKFLLLKPALIGRPAKWMLQMSEFDIVFVSPKAIKGQAVADLLAAFPGEDSTTLQDDVPGEFPEISVVKEETWLMYFDGSATPSNDTGGAGIVLVSPSGEAGAMHLEIRGDSKLLVNQMNVIYSLKEITLAPFRAEAQRILTHFANATITHTGRTNNRDVDCLENLASKLQFEGSEKAIIVQRRAVSSTWLSQTEDSQENDWRAPIIHEPSSSVTEGTISLQELKNFFLIHEALYHRNPDASLSWCLGVEEAKEKLESVHQEVCGQTLVVTLYRILQRLGYYWPSMEAQSRTLQGSCPNCQTPPHHLEALTLHHTGDWRHPYIEYLRDNKSPPEKKDIISRTIHENPRSWHEQLPMDLRAYGTAPRSSIGTSPYSLVYGVDAILPAEIKIPSTRIASASGIRWDEAEVSKSRVAKLDMLESRRAKLEKYVEAYKQRISRSYNKMGRMLSPKQFLADTIKS
ncbi:uncharacterized protein LOC113350766 [Papaver somniferum]|uniref:uncharacterized protein LOC113350766 n=1 Tax=Papaver somniferum TaxID=3469 RepID=UPI000E6F5F72|nr:uncharacterized protein LOC113350766 [Papaver somniferum]